MPVIIAAGLDDLHECIFDTTTNYVPALGTPPAGGNEQRRKIVITVVRPADGIWYYFCSITSIYILAALPAVFWFRSKNGDWIILLSSFFLSWLSRKSKNRAPDGVVASGQLHRCRITKLSSQKWLESNRKLNLYVWIANWFELISSICCLEFKR